MQEIPEREVPKEGEDDTAPKESKEESKEEAKEEAKEETKEVE